MLEVAARPIGGRCSKALRFGAGMPLEELVLRHAIGEDIAALRLADTASGVMMIPIPRGGVFEGVAGVDGARAVEGVDDLMVTAKEGQILLPLPEGASYLGFIFARGGDPAQVELALRRDSNPRTMRLLQSATEAAERGAKLTAQMLAFSRKQE